MDSNAQVEFDRIKVQFGEDKKANELSLADFLVLTDNDVKDLIERVDYPSKASLRRMRQAADNGEVLKRLKYLEQKQFDMELVLPAAHLKLAQSSCVQILNCDQSYAGVVGFFVRPSLIATAYHNIKDRYGADDTIYVKLPDDGDETGAVVECKLKHYSDHYDFAVLTSTYESQSFLMIKEDIDSIPNGFIRLAITTFNYSVSTQCPDVLPPPSFAVIPATLVKKSKNHFLYNSNLFSGDSGGALIHANDGKVIGIHLETVNEANEQLRTSDCDLDEVASSVNILTSGLSQGFVGLRFDSKEVLDMIGN